MKKNNLIKNIIVLILGIIFAQDICFAEPQVTFIYINGSNSNSEADREWFDKRVKSFHPVIKKKIEKNLNNTDIKFTKYGYKVNPEPKIFYWGDESKKDLEYMRSQIKLTKSHSPTFAYFARFMITAYLHDAIWVMKSANMIPILYKLNESVKEETSKGNKVVIFGYSAGSFISYEYIFKKYRYINLKEFLNLFNISEDMKQFIEANPRENTCFAGIEAGEIGAFDSFGKFIVENADSRLKEKYLKINDLTQVWCAPKNAVLGTVNFGSQLSLFYSDLINPKYEFFIFNKYMLKYIMENGLFFITVNFVEDPIGFPTGKNMTLKEMEEITELNMDSSKGIFFDNSTVKSWRPLILAHTSYYNARKIFSDAIIKTLVSGYRFEYDKIFQEKAVKKRDKLQHQDSFFVDKIKY